MSKDIHFSSSQPQREDFVCKREMHLTIESSDRGIAIASLFSCFSLDHLPTCKQQSSYAASVAWIHYHDKSNTFDSQ